jgi:hypothetical protein
MPYFTPCLTNNGTHLGTARNVDYSTALGRCSKLRLKDVHSLQPLLALRIALKLYRCCTKVRW